MVDAPEELKRRPAQCPAIEEGTRTDEEIAHRVLHGDPRAFDDLFDRFARPLLGYLAGMVGSRAAAEDLLQEAMIRVYQNIHSYREQGTFRAWIYRIATNLALTHLRRLRHAGPARQAESERITASTGPDALTLLERLQETEIVRRGLAELPEEQRAALLLRLRGEMGIGAIARVLGIPPGTVKSRLHYAVEHLREYAAREMGGSGRGHAQSEKRT